MCYLQNRVSHWLWSPTSPVQTGWKVTFSVMKIYQGEKATERIKGKNVIVKSLCNFPWQYILRCCIWEVACFLLFVSLLKPSDNWNMLQWWFPNFFVDGRMAQFREYKLLATHYSVLAQKIPWTEGPGRLQSKGLQRIAHDWAQQGMAHMPYLAETTLKLSCSQWGKRTEVSTIYWGVTSSHSFIQHYTDPAWIIKVITIWGWHIKTEVEILKILNKMTQGWKAIM